MLPASTIKPSPSGARLKRILGFILLGASLCILLWSFRQDSPTLKMSLTYGPESQDWYALALWESKDKQVLYEFRKNEVAYKKGLLPQAESQKLLAELRNAGAWQLADEDLGDKSDVYIEMTVEGKRSKCRGWAPDYGKVFQALLNEEEFSLELARVWTWCSISHRIQAGKGRASIRTPANHP